MRGGRVPHLRCSRFWCGVSQPLRAGLTCGARLAPERVKLAGCHDPSIPVRNAGRGQRAAVCKRRRPPLGMTSFDGRERQKGFLAQKACDGEPYLAACTPAAGRGNWRMCGRRVPHLRRSRVGCGVSQPSRAGLTCDAPLALERCAEGRMGERVRRRLRCRGSERGGLQRLRGAARWLRWADSPRRWRRWSSGRCQ